MRDSSRRGFSLIELLVVLLLLAALLTMVFWIINANNLSARQGMARSEVYAAGRAGRNTLANDFKHLLGPSINPVTTAYPDRDSLTLAPALDYSGQRGCMVVIPGVRQGRFPNTDGSPGKPVLLRCDQLFFLADTREGGIAPSSNDLSNYHSLLVPNAGATQVAVWVGPVTPSDEVVDADGISEAQSWCLGRQVVLLKDPLNSPGTGTPFPPVTGVSELSPLHAKRASGDVATFPLADYTYVDGGGLTQTVTGVTRQLLNLSPAIGPAPATANTALITAVAIPVPAGAPVAKSTSADPTTWPWPTVGADTAKDSAVTNGDVAANHRVFLRHCSECIIQVAMDGNFNGVPDTTNLVYDPTADPANPPAIAGQTPATHPGSYFPAAQRTTKNFNGTPVTAWVPDPTRNNSAACYYPDSRNWINSSKGLPGSGTPDGTGYNGTNLNRDLSGDIAWTPSDIAFNADPANAKGTHDPLVFWPQDAQPRIMHYGYYQGPADSTGKDGAGVQRYWGTTPPGQAPGLVPAPAGVMDWTPYPPVNYALWGGAATLTNFGAGIEYGDYIPVPAWNNATDYSAGGAVVSSGGNKYRALAAAGNINKVPPNAAYWTAALTGADKGSYADYLLAMSNYEALHGWNPARQRASGGPLAGLPPPPQSTWPTLVRIRVRLHDRTGSVRSYMDNFLTNGRDNDGDGVANNTDEARAAPGIWFEYVFSLPYPRMQTASMAAPTGTMP